MSYRDPGTHMVSDLDTGERFEASLPTEVYRDLLEGLKRYRNATTTSDPIPDRVRIGSFDWWRADNVG